MACRCRGKQYLWGMIRGDFLDPNIRADLIRGGELDGALIATRAWDPDGVTSLQALQAPFLITSQALEDRVVSGPLAAPMLAGLRRAGVIGLALLPADLLHPFGSERRCSGPRTSRRHDPRGPSRATERLLAALGAKATHPNGTAFNLAVRHGRIDGAEWYFEGLIPGGRRPRRGTSSSSRRCTRSSSRTKVFDALTAAQRAALDRAAADTLAYVAADGRLRTRRRRRSTARRRPIVARSPAEVAALERAAAPVCRALEAGSGDPASDRGDPAAEGANAGPAAIATVRDGRSAPAARPVRRLPARASRTGSTASSHASQELLAAGATRSDAVTTTASRRLRSRATAGGTTLAARTARRARARSATRATGRADDDVRRVDREPGARRGWTLRGGELRFLDALDGSGRAPTRA